MNIKNTRIEILVKFLKYLYAAIDSILSDRMYKAGNMKYIVVVFKAQRYHTDIGKI